MRRALHWYRAVGFILLAIPFFAPTVYSQSKTDEAAVHDVPRAFAAAWAKHDGNLLAKTMADDIYSLRSACMGSMPAARRAGR
jgi:hypothetical protein